MDYKRLRELREKAGLTQEEMARSVGLSVFSYTRYERGKSEPRFTTVVTFARHLGNLLPETDNILLQLAEERK